MAEQNLSHSIRKQDFEVEFNGTESEGLNLQRSLSDLCHNRLMPAIENALDRYVPANDYLTIDRLNIDIGTVSLELLDSELPQMVDKALGIYFQNIPQRDELSNSLRSDHIQRKTRQQTINEAFIFFLKHGTLPWSFHLPSGSEFEEMVHGSLTEIEGRGSTLERLKIEVIETLASATARKRLIQQFTPSLLETVLSLISTEGIKVISGLLPLLRRSEAALFDAKRLEQEIWECSFASIASGSPLTDAFVRRETQALVMAFGVRGASLAAVMDSYWSDVPQKEAFQAEAFPPTSLSQPTDGIADKEKKVVHHKRTTHGSVTSEGDALSHPSKENILAQRLSESARSLQRSGGAGDKEKERHHQMAKSKKAVSRSAIKHPYAKAGIYTGLAGLVLLHPFLPQLFKALGIADDDNLLQPERAIYLLYFLATGRIDAKEYELVIPKMLCHFPLQRALESNIIIATAEQEEGSAMLAAVIRHWEVLKNTGVEGLRETFFKRSGKLSLLDNGEWLLQVESNACDILLEQLPWGISMIKLPWMQEMLRVEWV